MDELASVEKSKPSAWKKALQNSAVRLRERENLITLTVAYLFCGVVLFALWVLIKMLAFFILPTTLLGALLLLLMRGGVAFLFLVSVLFPLFAGRLRMVGMIAVGKEVALAELFHYFGTWHLWWRSVRLCLLLPFVLFIPPLFSVPALVLGNEDASFRYAFCFSMGRVRLSLVLAFWCRVLVRFLLGVLTLGLLWLLYDAHHSTMTYFSLVMKLDTEENT